MTNKLLLTRGAPASGKDTIALKWVKDDPDWRTRVNRDELRWNMYGEWVLPRMGEETVTLVQQNMVRTLLKAGQNVIVSDTNLAARFVKEWLKIAVECKVEVEFVDVPTPLEECLRRNKARADAGGRFVPEDVIRNYFARYFRNGELPPVPTLDAAPTFSRTYVQDPALPTAYVVDIDGTLAKMTGRGPFEWHRVGEDEPIQNVIDTVRSLKSAGHKIIFMSGRDEVSRNDTVRWLFTYAGIAANELYMRSAGDMRRDNIVKYELFWKHVGERYNVLGVIDDRNQVVEMWRELGLTVFQCAIGDF